MLTHSLTPAQIYYIRGLYSFRISQYRVPPVTDISAAIYTVFNGSQAPAAGYTRKQLVPLLMSTMSVGRNAIERAGGILNQMVAVGVLIAKRSGAYVSFIPDPNIKEPKQPEPLIQDLANLSDNDAIEVARIGGVSPVNGDEVNSLIRFGKELINAYLKSSRCNVRGEDWMQIAFYLLQQGYAVPLFIAPHHPDNGKTVLDLGIEITPARPHKKSFNRNPKPLK